MCDLRSDGDNDLMTGGGSVGLCYFENTGNGIVGWNTSVTPVLLSPGSSVLIFRSGAAADLNSDGWLDLVAIVVEGTASPVQMLMWCV